MAVPTYDKFIEPVLRFLATKPEGAHARDVHEAAADSLGVSPEARQQLLPSGTQPIYKNRVGWAHDRLKRAGLSVSKRRGYWQITDLGKKFLEQHPQPLSADEVERIAIGYMDVRLKPRAANEEFEEHAESTDAGSISAISSPDDRLGEAIEEIRRSVASEILDVLSSVSSASFESIVLDLLHKMGYGTSRADLQRVGGSGDGGIDGIISLDKLGLEKVYVQAKRWKESTVGRPDIQAFYGALAGQRANKGVFITTSSFSSQAIEFAKSVERIVLVDGARLADLMIDHEVGVSARTVKVPKLDSDYFDEEIS
jgi:restriction system protein